MKSLLRNLLAIIIILAGGAFILYISSFETTSKEEDLDFWNSNIYIQYQKTDISPDYLFKTFPEFDIYPENKIVYYKLISHETINNRDIISTQIIQNRKVLFIYQFYFEKGNYLKLNTIEISDKTTGEVKIVKNSSELLSLLEIYKEFIDLYKTTLENP